jgi:hypothetical protein
MNKFSRLFLKRCIVTPLAILGTLNTAAAGDFYSAPPSGSARTALDLIREVLPLQRVIANASQPSSSIMALTPENPLTQLTFRLTLPASLFEPGKPQFGTAAQAPLEALSAALKALPAHRDLQLNAAFCDAHAELQQQRAELVRSFLADSCKLNATLAFTPLGADCSGEELRLDLPL